MPQWKNTDDAANSVIWAPAQLGLVVNTVNQTALFGNVTADAYYTGATIGQFAADDGEVAASLGAIPHTGYVLRKEGSGNRAGRVHYEVLVAGNITGSDASDDTTIPDYTILITTNPVDASTNVTPNADIVTQFSVVAQTVPAGGTLTYRWVQSANNVVFVNCAAGTAGNTTATLNVHANTTASNLVYKAIVGVTGGATVETTVGRYTETT